MKNAQRALIPSILLLAGLSAVQYYPARAQSFADPAFQHLWERTDKPVTDGKVKRSFYWGPAPGESKAEQYAEGVGGKRLVQYFDKSRMEINNPNGNKNDPFYVTNGLLTVELVTGRMQVGNSQFVDRYPAQIPLASDTDDDTAPTYATFNKLMAKADNHTGQGQINTIDRDGNITLSRGVLPTRQQMIAYYEPSTGHNIPQVFWDFLNASGPVYASGAVSNARLNDPWFYAAGLPISEPYWAKVKIAGQRGVEVYIQAYQRRVLTYVPSLPEGFQVQMGNIGQHYYDWRYKDAGKGGTGGTPTPEPTVGGSTTGRVVVGGAVTATLSLDVAGLGARNPQNISATFRTPGGGTETHTYKGPLLLDILKEVGGNGNSGRDLPIRYILATGQGGQKAVVSWGEIDPIFAGTQAIVAYQQDSANLQGAQAPARLWQSPEMMRLTDSECA